MKKLSKKIISSVTFTLLCATYIFQSANIVNAQELPTSEFHNLLDSNNISVSGNCADMTISEINGFLSGTKYEESSTLYTHQADTNTIKMTPEEILELHYISLSDEEKSKFLDKVRNQTVDIHKKDNVILISYNPNIQSIRATSTIESWREASIRMQDSISGNWGSATVALTGYFTKTTSGNTWTISLKNSSDFSVSESNTLPVHIVGTTVYWEGAYYSSSGTYIGNEINISSYTEVACGFNSSGLSIYVYPNSSYNSASIE